MDDGTEKIMYFDIIFSGKFYKLCLINPEVRANFLIPWATMPET